MKKRYMLHCKILGTCQLIGLARVKTQLLVERSWVVLAHMDVLKYGGMLCAYGPYPMACGLEKPAEMRNGISNNEQGISNFEDRLL